MTDTLRQREWNLVVTIRAEAGSNSIKLTAASLVRTKPTPTSCISFAFSFPEYNTVSPVSSSCHSSTSIPPHLADFQYADGLPSHFRDHPSAIPSFVHGTGIPLPNLHTQFWRKQFHRRFRRHSLLRTVIQLGDRILGHHTLWCSDLAVTCFGFCFFNKHVFTGGGY